VKRYTLTILLSLVLLSGYLGAQVKVWQPYLRFRCDAGTPPIYNRAEENFLMSGYAGQQGGQDHRFADGTGELQYYFNLLQFQDAQNQHPLTLRIYLWGQYVVETSSTPMSSTDGGATGNTGNIVAQYAAGPPWTADAGDAAWIEIPLQQYYDIGQTDLYIAFFDGRYSDGNGPSVSDMGLWYTGSKDAGTGVKAVEATDGVFDITNINSFPSITDWVTMTSGGTGITSVGTVTGLSAKVGVGFDPEDVYFAADVTDATVANSDSVIFYFGAYDITDSLTTNGHLAFMGDSLVTGYREKNEPDFRFIVTNVSGTPKLTVKLLDTTYTPDSSSVNVSAISGGYRVIAKISKADFVLKDVIQNKFKPDVNAYYPIAFRVVDGATGGSLITSKAADVDVNPCSWGLRTIIIDRTTTNVVSNVAEGDISNIIPGNNDSTYLVYPYYGSNDKTHRWADGTDTVAYHFNLQALRAKIPNQQLYVSFNIENEYIISTSTTQDGAKTQVGVWDTKGVAVTDASNNNNFEIALPTTGNDLYVWFADGIPTDGWGPAIHKINIYYKGVYKDSSLIAFNAGGSDAAYLVADTGSGHDSQHRWADGTNSFGYEFDLTSLKPQIPVNSTPYFNVHVGNMWVLTVASDVNGTQYALDKWDSKGVVEVHDESNLDWHKYSLQPYIDSGWTHVVFFFHDGTTTDGWGASVRDDFTTIPNVEQPGVKITVKQILAYYKVDEFQPTSTPSATSEANYLVQTPTGYTGSGSDATHRWADNSSIIAYKFVKSDLLQKTNNATDITAKFDLDNEYVIWTNNILDTTGVNSSAKNPGKLKMLYQYSSNRTVGLTDASNRGTLEVSLSDVFAGGDDTAYVFFTDGMPSTGWGPEIHDVVLGYYKVATITGISKDKYVLPTKFALNQNYPNPFNPSTTISYDIPQTGKVVLKIYNILGQEVKTLLNNVVTPGRYQMTWNGDNNFGRKLASGIYLYQMIYNKQQVVKKMVLLK